MTTAHDEFVIGNSSELREKFKAFQKSSQSENLYEKFKVKPKKGWNILDGWTNLQRQNIDSFVKPILYRPFEETSIFYEEKLVWRPVRKIFDHFSRKNIGLCLIRINSRDEGLTVFITDKITDKTLLSSKDNANIFPLYLYPTEGEEKLGETRKPNLDEKIWHKIDACLDSSTPFPSASSGNYAQNDNSHITTPEQIFDYIYGVLHTPSYREKYGEFLKIDFPRIPYPENKEEFERIVSIGNKLRKLHLMEEIPPQASSFNIEGDNTVSEIRFERHSGAEQRGAIESMDPIGASPLQGDIYGKVYINKTQYFANVPELAWNFYIGGYQPAQKWLKDRKNRTLTYDDISHYRKIIAILIETQNLMQELDKKT